MIGLRFGVALILVWGGSALAVGAGDDPAATPAGESTEVLTAADFVQAALQAEVAGDSARRTELLQEALANDSEYAPARWHSGYVRLNGKWKSLAEVQDTYRADPRLVNYQQRRIALAESPDRDLQLARWCQEQRLAEQARFHWLNVLRVVPDHEEALMALDVRWMNGRLVKTDQVAQQKRADFQAMRDTVNSNSTRKRHCEAMIAGWERVAEEDEAGLLAQIEADLAAESSPNTIPMLNYLLGERSRSPRNPKAFQAVSVQWLKILGKDPNHTKFLVLHAIGHPQEPVRIAAAEELKSRPREAYVPLLLSCARFPAEFACNLLASTGLSQVQCTLDIQGLESDMQIQHLGTLERIAGLDSAIGPTVPGSTIFVFGGETPEQTARVAAWRRATTGSVRAMNAYVNYYNSVSELINQRIVTALAPATGEKLEADPRVWQNWWKEYLCDYYELEGKQEDGDQTDDGQQPARQPPEFSRPIATSSQQLRPLRRFLFCFQSAILRAAYVADVHSRILQR